MTGNVMTTIRDIARVAGVGVGTVSRVLNGTGYVSEATQQRVWDAIKSKHYIPNGAARALATRRTMVLGVLLHDLTNPFVAGMAQGIQEEARRAGYTIMLLDTDWQNEVQDSVILRQQALDGVILVSPAYANVVLTTLQEINVPVVVVDRGDTEGISHITIDHYQGVLDVVNWAKTQGHTQIGFLAGPAGLRFADRRLRAYLDAMGWKDVEITDLEHRLDLPVVHANFRFETGYQATKILLERHPTLSCIVAANDLSALGAMRYLVQQNIPVPDRIAVTGFDDILTASLVHPSLTTVHQPIHEMGVASARLVIDMIKKGVSLQKEQQVFPVTLVVRESC
jgi:DNA-binding LacI/PurR family transcriptional regulator